MQGGKNWILPKQINANRFFWDSHWLEIWSNHFCPSMGLNGGSVATDSGDILGTSWTSNSKRDARRNRTTRGCTTRTGYFKCREVKTGFYRNKSMQTGSSGTFIGWKSGQTTFVPLCNRMEGAWLRTLEHHRSRDAGNSKGITTEKGRKQQQTYHEHHG